jgi:hypothetical protein
MRDVNPLDLAETTREGILVLEPDLTIRFCDPLLTTTHIRSASADRRAEFVYEIGNGQWDIPQLRTSVETIISGCKTIEAFEVEQFSPYSPGPVSYEPQSIVAPQ